MKWKFKLNTPIDSRGHAQRTQEVSGTNRCVYVIRHNDISTTPTSRPPHRPPPHPRPPQQKQNQALSKQTVGLRAQRLNTLAGSEAKQIPRSLRIKPNIYTQQTTRRNREVLILDTLPIPIQVRTKKRPLHGARSCSAHASEQIQTATGGPLLSSQ